MNKAQRQVIFIIIPFFLFICSAVFVNAYGMESQTARESEEKISQDSRPSVRIEPVKDQQTGGNDFFTEPRSLEFILYDEEEYFDEDAAVKGLHIQAKDAHGKKLTVSAEADKLIRQAAVTDMTESLAYDCLCSAAIEQVCNRAEEEIFAGSKVYRTWRFSPGYGDLPISLQKELLYALNAQRRIGLTVTANSLLIPSKSVTAIIGVSDEPITQHKKGGCAECNMRGRCAFSKEGSNRCQM